MAPAADLVCFSHLRWDGVTQRPHHLVREAARERRVLYVEEPETGDLPPAMHVRMADGVTVATPRIPEGIPDSPRRSLLRAMVHDLLDRHAVRDPWLWFWTPTLHSWASGVRAQARIYDRMDDLACFRGAPPDLRAREDALFADVNVVFTGGQSLYEATRARHPRVHPFPSSVDIEHFRRARDHLTEPEDHALIPHPRIGWFGVIDERFDLELVHAVARARPSWQLVLIGPTAKIDEADLPQEPNLHWLGPRPYAGLPAYLGGWDVAIMPFARNEATRYISPTKTPEYLAGGRPVVSTSIHDVVEPYGRAGLVRIADEPGAFVGAIEAALEADLAAHLRRADAVLDGQSWSSTWRAMARRVEEAVADRDLRVRPTARLAVPSGQAATP